MVWYHINSQSGVQHVPHMWAGVFVLLVARFLFPSINIALVDADCVPVSLFEVEDLIRLSKLQMSAHSTRTPPGGISASDQPTPDMLLFSEQFHDINAGLVVSIGDPNADVIDLSMPVNDLERVLFASRDVLLASSVPRQPPTTMLRRRAGWGPQWQASKGGGGGGPERVRGGIALWGVAEGPSSLANRE